ncbi:MAG: IS66 family transposase [Planctomycetes bacterium]|nr:IS66 family transposase [Planctomycetota bacterium]
MSAKKTKKTPLFDNREQRLAELHAIVERVEGTLSPADVQSLKSAVETLALVTGELEDSQASLKRLRAMLFGTSTESRDKLFGAAPPSSNGDDAAAQDSESAGAGSSSEGDPAAEKQEKKKRKGHGRNPASDYRGAQREHVPKPGFENGGPCPCCTKGKVYPLSEPSPLVRVHGMAPLSATVYELERWRCHSCGEIFTAPTPPGVGEEKYDEGASAMIALLKYGAGFPFHRLEKLQRNLGIPLPASTQWELVYEASLALSPIHDELITRAAQGNVIHNDDTRMRVLDPAIAMRRAAESEAKKSSKERRGIFTTGIVAELEEQQRVALFYTGPKHAGENLEALLEHRRAELAPPIQMSDALSRNLPSELETLVSHCLVHARRNFVDVKDSFPKQVRHVVDLLASVYANDAEAKNAGLGAEERLRLHQAKSQPHMDELEAWMKTELAEKRVEPNSGLGKAIAYMQTHWQKLTLFLRESGAPLDNNICERALKKAILHRKNALFYKTENGAKVGDLFMSLIHTAELAGVDAFPYLVALLKHGKQVAREPGRWLPWNYQEMLVGVGGEDARAG